jgi:hypothetical protein
MSIYYTIHENYYDRYRGKLIFLCSPWGRGKQRKINGACVFCYSWRKGKKIDFQAS